MITSKYIVIITAVAMVLSFLTCGFIVYAANTFDTARFPEYQKRLFGEEAVTIDIQVSEDDWQGLLDNAQAKEWISADLVVNGQKFSTIGIRTKGNSSLSMGNRMGGSSDGNYSLQFKANKYIKGQTFYGLDVLSVNNMVGDATYMKDYIAYDIMNYIGVATPLTNYASVTVNGEDYGFGIMLERYEQSFLDRVYNSTSGQLYNVKIGMGMHGDFEDMRQNVENSFPSRRQDVNNTELPAVPDGTSQQVDGSTEIPTVPGGERPQGGGSLVYTDNNISSYSSIFDNAVFNNNSDSDKQRVITALENMNAGTDLEKYIDVDATLRYFAAHTVMVNLDSYTSNMAQNYYLYERDGELTILPWDYNLSFGGMSFGDSSGASDVVNYPIDTPVNGVAMEDRPLLNKLLEVDEYMQRYHEYLRQIVEGYFESGLYESTIRELDTKINDYVKSDVSAFFTYEQYEASLSHLIELGLLRAESIRGQLDGTIPTTSSRQNDDMSSLIDASSVNLSALGSMGGQQGKGGQQPGDIGAMGMFDMEQMQQAMPILTEADGELTNEAKDALLELGLSEEQIGSLADMQNSFPGMGGIGGMPDRERQTSSSGGGQGNIPDENANGTEGINRQKWNNAGGMVVSTSSNTSYAVLIVIMLIVLAGATAFVAKPRRTRL
ncbi:MAG: spore coat protein CotH [Firmicutes bacterium HGW-Firmicutes-3]|jgi:spore coat protein CotH|nr:MAG: spore coat protein CotH [Firmicutes bacterium HGW-Firmicutes-3]